MRAIRLPVLALLLTAAVSLTGCVQFNRSTYQFNEAVSVVSRPVVDAILVLPEDVRDRPRLFLENIRYGDVVANQFLQGKACLGFQDLLRWVINSTMGILGMFDVAATMGFEKHDEDFGQTLAVWGLPQGRYLVLPIVGPTTDRDMVGFAVSFFTNPSLWVDEPLISTPLTVLSYVNQAVEARAGLNQVASEAADPYTFVREAYLQRRRYLIYDGNPPPRPGEGEALDELDFDALEEDLADPEADPSDEAGGVDDLPGLDELDAEAPVRTPDDLPGLEDLAPTPAPKAGALPDLDDADTLPGLDG